MEILDKKIGVVIDAETFISPKYSEKELRSIVGGIITSQLALDSNEQIKYTKYYKHSLKKALNVSIKALINAEKTGFDTLINSDIEKQAITVYDVLYLLIQEIISFDFPDYGDLIRVLRAYKADKKSIMGISKKILKHEKT